ncbi:MAG: hypothetical protein GY718_20545 [Lentisphaerae bacterium]|nr:hypothetical protein [Lentisphaerota bacterium]
MAQLKKNVAHFDFLNEIFLVLLWFSLFKVTFMENRAVKGVPQLKKDVAHFGVLDKKTQLFSFSERGNPKLWELSRIGRKKNAPERGD